MPGKTSITPLPWRCLIPLTIYRLAINALYSVVFPFQSEQILALGVDPARVGLVTGAIDGVMLLGEGISGPLWGHAVDPNGWAMRKKGLLIWSTGFLAALSVLSAFWVDHVWQLLLVRFFLGLYGGNTVLLRVAFIDSCDQTNLIRGYAVFAMGLPLGMAAGPWIGGGLANAADRYELFENVDFLKRYPYALPSLAMAAMQVVTFFALLPMTETVKPAPTKEEAASGRGIMTWGEMLRHPTLGALLALIGFGSFWVFSFDPLWPLIAYTPISGGGYSLSTPLIGFVMGTSTFVALALNTFLLPWMDKQFGVVRNLRFSSAACLPAMALLLLVSWIRQAEVPASLADGSERDGHLGMSFWTFVVVQVVVKRFLDFSMTLAEAALPAALPHPSLIARAISIAFVIGSITRGVGVVALSGLFSFCSEGEPWSLRRAVFWIVLFSGSVYYTYLGFRPLTVNDEKTAGRTSEEYELVRNMEDDEEDMVDPPDLDKEERRAVY